YRSTDVRSAVCPARSWRLVHQNGGGIAYHAGTGDAKLYIMGEPPRAMGSMPRDRRRAGYSARATAASTSLRHSASSCSTACNFRTSSRASPPPALDGAGCATGGGGSGSGIGGSGGG